MKIRKKDFDFFVAECKRWIKRFHLIGWQVDFRMVELSGNAGAELRSDYVNSRATIALSPELTIFNSMTIEEELAMSAKHEVIHLLLRNFSALASARYVTMDELDKAEEELVRKLTTIINDQNP